jgi:hypothetical protein
MFDGVEALMSEDDIGAGERSLPKIAEELSGTTFGIIVVTPENQFSQWLNYESGALSKGVKDQAARVAPSLVGFERKGDAEGPIAQFQATLLDREGVGRILVEIAKVFDIKQDPIRTRFERAWAADYENRFSEASQDPAPAPPQRRPEPEVLDEILNHVRGLSRTSRAASSASAADKPSVPLEIPLVEIRRVLASFLGDSLSGITLSTADTGGVSVMVPVRLVLPLTKRVNELAGAVVAIDGVDECGFVARPET